jgi:hypothetical protein
MFDSIINLGKGMKRLNQNKIFGDVVSDNTLQSQMIDLNQDQLQSGYDANDKSTGNYSKTSVEVYGKEPGPITLKDTGAFYDSMKVTRDADSFEIKGQTLKPDRDLLDRWPNALGLTDENMTDLMPEITELTIEKIKNEILRIY